MGLWEVGPHCVGEEAEVARLGWVFRMHEDVTVLVVSVAGRGVDAGKFLGSWLSCNEDRFYLLVCLTPPAIAWKLFALSSMIILAACLRLGDETLFYFVRRSASSVCIRPFSTLIGESWLQVARGLNASVT